MFRDGKFSHGKIVFADGSVYEGSLENGKKSGKGYLKKADGSFYEGYF